MQECADMTPDQQTGLLEQVTPVTKSFKTHAELQRYFAARHMSQ